MGPCLVPDLRGITYSFSPLSMMLAVGSSYMAFIMLRCFPSVHILKKIFFYLWLCWVFVSVRGLSLVAASGGRSSSWCAGLSLSRPLPLQSTGSRRAGSAIVAHGPSRSVACGIFPDQGSNPCPLHWQADSQPLRHQGSPVHILLRIFYYKWMLNLVKCFFCVY